MDATTYYARHVKLGLFLLAVGVAAVLVGGAAEPAAKTERPNIVVVETDDQTVSDLRAMPNVERLLAARGTTFVNSFVANSLCCPSRATFLTGQYSHNNGVWDNGPPAGGYETFRLSQGNSLAVWLQRAGYTTIQLGKYLNGYGNSGDAGIPAGWTDWNAAFGRTWKDYFGVTLNENGVQVPYPGRYQADLYADKGVELIRKYSGTGRPFFFWLCFLAPHSGKQPTQPGAVPAPRDAGHFGALPLPKPPSYNEADVSDKPAEVRALPLIDKTAEAGIRLGYERRLESLLSVDRAVARIVKVLGDLHELDRTLIVFTSDNGFMTGEHRIDGGKEVVYEPSIRVPLIVRGPEVAAHGVVTTLVSNIDLAPTFIEVAGAQAGRKIDGRSLVPLLHNPRLHWNRELLIESPLHGRNQVFTAIRSDRYLYAEYENGERELYDLARDPYELTSLHAEPAYTATRKQLAKKLAALRRCRGESCSSPH
jgi:N-acetylglucosamine-6-sulfatase